MTKDYYSNCSSSGCIVCSLDEHEKENLKSDEKCSSGFREDI